MALFSTGGRLNRARYFGFILIFGIINGILSFIVQTVDSIGALIFIIALYIPCLVANVCVVVKRLHDLDRPGSHYWLLLVPLYNIFLSLMLLFSKGTVGKNQFGSDPIDSTFSNEPPSAT